LERRQNLTDDQVEKLIWAELKKRAVTIYDMIGLPNHGVDPVPENETLSAKKRTRCNRFQSPLGCERMKELLCAGEYNPYDDYLPIRIPLQDLFRFWWNRCVEKELVVDEVLEDIYDHFTDLMRPPEKETEQMDLTVDFEQLSLSATDMENAA